MGGEIVKRMFQSVAVKGELGCVGGMMGARKERNYTIMHSLLFSPAMARRPVTFGTNGHNPPPPASSGGPDKPASAGNEVSALQQMKLYLVTQLSEDAETAVFAAMMFSLLALATEPKVLVENFLKKYPDADRTPAELEGLLDTVRKACGKDPMIKRPKFGFLEDKAFQSYRQDVPGAALMAATLIPLVMATESAVVQRNFEAMFPDATYTQEEVKDALEMFRL